MKTNLLILALSISSFSAWSQTEMVTISVGYSWAHIQDYSATAKGWRLNGLYEFNPNDGQVVHGIALGNIRTYASTTVTLGGQASTSDYRLSTWPLYYAPKYVVEKGSIKAFIKGALGMQLSSLKITSDSPGVLGNDFGFYGGAGVGLMKTLNENLFLSIEYEWAFLSTNYYKNGIMNTAMLGIGYTF